MHRRRASQPSDFYIDIHQQQHQQASSSSPSSSSPSSPVQSSSKPRSRAASSALGLPTIVSSAPPTPNLDDSETPIMPSSSPPPLPSFLTRPGRNRMSNRLIAYTVMFALVLFILVFPSNRTKGKAAVENLGGAVGQAWEKAGDSWEKWRPAVIAPMAGQGADLSHSSSISSSKTSGAVRQRPNLHEDPTKTTRCLRSFDGQKNVVQYAIMIDAGSTGSRVHVYKFNYCDASPELENEVFEMLRPGLSFFKGNPTGAADSLRPLLQTSMDSIPASLRSCTPIAVKATAGLRLLGQTESRSILKEVRRMIKEEYPFQLADGRKGEGLTELTGDGGAGRAVEIMEGKDEGVFAWITVNYLLGLIGPPLPGHTRDSQKHTAAVMDLGGASTQIVFEPKYADGEQGMRPGEHVYELKDFGGRDYILYQNSYLGYGLMQARKSINSLAAFAFTYSHPEVVLTGNLTTSSPSSSSYKIPSPCFALGTEKSTKIAKLGGGSRKSEEEEVKFVGTTGGFEACRRLVEVMMDKDAVCANQPCSFAGVYQPSLLSTFRSGSPIVALSYFYDRLAPLGLSSKSSSGFSLVELADLARKVCMPPSTWSTSFPINKYPEALKELQDRPESCLDITYLYSLLTLGYELEDTGSVGQKIRTEKQLGGIELGWALGAAVGMIGEMPGCKVVPTIDW